MLVGEQVLCFVKKLQAVTSCTGGSVCILKMFALRGLLEKYPTFGREKETGLPGALDT